MRSLLKSKITLLLLFFIISIYNLTGQNIPAPMDPPRLVNDFAKIFSKSERANLEQKLLTYNDSTSTQIYVVTVEDLQGYEISDYSFALGEKWGIGAKKKDNGILILIKPKTKKSRGNLHIALGYGIEPYISDGFVGRVVRNNMIEYFKREDYYGGVVSGVDMLTERLSGEFKGDSKRGEEKSPISFIVMGILFFAIFYLITKKGGNGGDQNIGGGRNRASTRIPMGGFPSSYGGSRGFSGGGGGSFGGGGAGGSW